MRQVGAVAQPAVRGPDQCDHRAAIAFRQYRDVVAIARERHGGGAAVQRAVAIELNMVMRPRRRDRHGALRRFDARARQQPAGNQRFGERNTQREAAGHAEYLETFGQANAGTAQALRHPGERQAGFAQCMPQRRFPGTILRRGDGLGVG